MIVATEAVGSLLLLSSASVKVQDDGRYGSGGGELTLDLNSLESTSLVRQWVYVVAGSGVELKG